MLTQSSSVSKNIEVPQDFTNLELDLKTILPSKEVQCIEDNYELMLKELHLKFNLELEALSKSFFNDLNSLQSKNKKLENMNLNDFKRCGVTKDLVNLEDEDIIERFRKVFLKMEAS